MARILDWPGLLSALAANWQAEAGDLGLALIDPFYAAAPRATIVHLGAGEAEIEPVEPAELPARRYGFLVGDIQGWSAVATGHYGAKAACEAGMLKASSPQAADLAERLFPMRAPFIPTADHF